MLMLRWTLLAALALGAPLHAGDYPMEGGNLRRHGQSLSPTTLVFPLDTQWVTQTCISEFVANPIVIEDKVILVSRVGVTCLRKADGQILWTRYAGLLWNSPAYDPDRRRLYIATYAGALFALDLDTGASLWSVNEGAVRGGYSMAAPTYMNDRILYCNGKGQWVSINADTQAVVWRRGMGAVQAGGTPSIDGGRIYAGGTKGFLGCLDWDDGSIYWQRQSGSRVSYASAILTTDDHFYVMQGSGKLECRLRSNGDPVWEYQTGSYAYGNPSTDGASIFCSSDDRCIHALEPLTGALKWRECHAGNFARSAPFHSGGKVFSSGCSGSFYGDDAISGANGWEAVHGFGNSFNDWAESDGWLFVGTLGGRVYCFRSSCPGCTPTATRTPSPDPSASTTPTPSATASESPTDNPSATPSRSATSTTTPTVTLTASSSPTPSATSTATGTSTRTASPTATSTAPPTGSPTRTASASPTRTVSTTPVVVPPTATPAPSDAPGNLDDPGDGTYAYPNPSDGGDVQLVYKVDGPCKARIRVFQSAGDPAALIEDRHESAGVKRCTVPAASFAPGIYFYKVDMRYDDGRHDKRKLGKFICRKP